jgi:hypothetical protein
MSLRVAVWGTGNVGRPAIRAVHANPELELAAVVVSDPAKVGRDAGDLCGLESLGVAATDDPSGVLSEGIDAVVYCATADTRPVEALADVKNCLRAGCSVVTTSLYGLLYPAATPEPLASEIVAACEAGNTSVFVSGIDPGWAIDVLPMLVSGVVADIQEIRCQEIFNYRHYDQPDVVRNVIGFGRSLEEVPPMLNEFALRFVWEPMIRIVAEGLGAELDAVDTRIERLPLERDIDVPSMGTFEAGTQGAFRFEVRGLVADRPRIVVEHITRIDDACGPQWPMPPTEGGAHRVLITGRPNLEVSIHSEDPAESGPAAGGNATAANRIVNAIPAVHAAPAGMLSPLDLPTMRGASLGLQWKNGR